MKSIIVVDDNPRALQSLVWLLESEGYRVHSTTVARQALSWILLGRGNLLITDFTMPQLSGAQLAVEAARWRPKLPVIIYTGGELPAAYARSNSYDGFALWLSKGEEVSVDELLNHVRRLLR